MTYSCIKCNGTEFETDEFRATGGTLAKVFDIQNKKFHTVTCKSCGYTEIYKRTTSTGENVLDFVLGT